MAGIVREGDEDWEFITGRAVAEEVFRTNAGDGVVYVYRIEPDEYHSDADFTAFYIAVYNVNGYLEPIWGFGETPKEALENAEMKWGEEEIRRMNLENRTSGYFNPFSKALEKFKKYEKEDEDEYMTGMVAGMLDVEGVLRADVGDGAVYVYRIDNFTDHDKLPLVNFYIATLYASNGAGGMEKVWGFGKTPKEALEYAEMNWDNLTGGYANPFRKALEMLKENEENNDNILQNY